MPKWSLRNRILLYLEGIAHMWFIFGILIFVRILPTPFELVVFGIVTSIMVYLLAHAVSVIEGQRTRPRGFMGPLFRMMWLWHRRRLHIYSLFLSIQNTTTRLSTNVRMEIAVWRPLNPEHMRAVEKGMKFELEHRPNVADIAVTIIGVHTLPVDHLAWLLPRFEPIELCDE